MFFDYALEKNKSAPNELKIKTLSALTRATYTEFTRHLIKKGYKKSIASKFATLVNFGKDLSDSFPDINLGVISHSRGKAREPLTEEAFNELKQALTKHIDTLYKKLSFRDLVDAAKAYTMEEIVPAYTEKYNKGTIYEWAQYRVENKIKIRKIDLIYKLNQSKDEELINLLDKPNTVELFKKAFHEREQCYKYEAPTDPFSGRYFQKWLPDDTRLIKTLLDNNYPMALSEKDLHEKYFGGANVTLQECRDILEVCLFRIERFGAAKFTIRVKTIDELLALYYPTMADMACIIMFIMLQSNWNKEAVMSLDESNLEHPLAGAILQEHTVIQSEKNRSQAIGKPFYEPKSVIAISSTADRYSSYNLIKLAKALSAPLKPYNFNFTPFGKDISDFNQLFLCIKNRNNWKSRGGRHTSSSYQKAFSQGVIEFLRSYPIYENGKKLESAADITARLRPTWTLQQKIQNNASIGLLAMQMTHADAQTTDIYYNSSPAALKEQGKRLLSEQEEVLQLLRQGKYEGMLGKRESEPLDLPLKIFHIPGMEKPMWACTNQRNPTWHGSSNYVKPGERCYVISKCLFCKQCNIFDDSLPYLIQRRIHIEDLTEENIDHESDFSNSLSRELEIINSILESWDDPETVKEASRYQRRNDPLLPRELDLLQVIFEEEDME
ncbi:hypothetical protein [Pseudomonas sp.]|uniref:hypothetical protein n=1 Tax=Pseudomonas sp. TaxID=306 RepID=UPI003BB7894F